MANLGKLSCYKKVRKLFLDSLKLYCSVELEAVATLWTNPKWHCTNGRYIRTFTLNYKSPILIKRILTPYCNMCGLPVRGPLFSALFPCPFPSIPFDSSTPEFHSTSLNHPPTCQNAKNSPITSHPLLKANKCRPPVNVTQHSKAPSNY